MYNNNGMTFELRNTGKILTIYLKLILNKIIFAGNFKWTTQYEQVMCLV